MADTTIDLLKNSSYVGKMDELIAAVKSGGGTASDVEWDNVKNKPTTIGGYGIIDAKIDNGTITLGNQTITPLTSAPVTSVNSKTGAVTLSAADVSAIPSTLTGTAGQVLTKTADGQEWKDVDIPTQLPNPNALTFTGAVTGSYDGSAPLSVEIPSGGGGSSTEPGYKDATTLFDVTLDDTTGGLKRYEYDVSGIEKTDVIIINILFPASYKGQITITNQDNALLAKEFPIDAKGMVIGLKAMNGRYMHSCAYSGNIAMRIDAPLSLFYGQLSGTSGFERPKAPDTITKLKFGLSVEFVSGTRIRAYRW